MARGIASSEGPGDIGEPDGIKAQLNMSTKNSDPYAIFALIDLWQATAQRNYLQLAHKVADNILQQHRLNGFFVDQQNIPYANIDNIDPYAFCGDKRSHPQSHR